MDRAAVLVLTAALFLTTTAWAAAKCDQHPKSEWMPQAEAKAKIEAQGYRISKFKVDGHCYEIYGFDKDGNRAEVYFDTKTLAVVKSEIKKK
jgi:hypothetical protein